MYNQKSISLCLILLMLSVFFGFANADASNSDNNSELLQINDDSFNDNSDTIHVTVPAPAGEKSLYDAYIYGVAYPSSVKQGQSVKISIDVAGYISPSWTYGIGLSLQDSNGQVWDVWSGHCVHEPGTSIDSQFILLGNTVTHSISFTLPSNFPTGKAKIIASVWKESKTPVSTRLANTGWMDAFSVTSATQCTSGACCSGGNFRSSSYVCDSKYNSEKSCQWGTGLGSDVGIRYQQRYCSGSSSSCSGTISGWGSWQVYQDCSSSQRCDTGTNQCVSAQCTSGACCDSNGYFRSSSYMCNSQYSSEYGCPDGTSDGSDISIRYLQQYCSGSSNNCNGGASWGNWQIYKACNTGEHCVVGSQNCAATQKAYLRTITTIEPAIGPGASDIGYPVANVEVLIDGTHAGYTNQFGAFDMENVAYGSHTIEFYLNTSFAPDESPKIYHGSTTFNVDGKWEKYSFILKKTKGTKGESNVIALTPYNGEKGKGPEVVVLAVVAVGFGVWDLGDLTRCATQQNSWWEGIEHAHEWATMCPGVTLFYDGKLCMREFWSVTQYTFDKCVPELSIFATNFIPISWINDAGKLAVKLGKFVRIIPHVDDTVSAGFKVTKIGSDFVEVAKDNKIFKFKLAGETLKLTDNAANMGVDIARRPEIKGNIFSKIDNLLRTTTKADILPSMRNEAGVKKFLGEESASRYIDEVAKSMKKEGATVTMIEGTAGNEWKTTTDYVFKFGDDGKTIKIFDKAGNPKGELDRVAKINDKYVMVESKGGAYDNYKKDLKFDDIEENKIIPFKEIDSKPEFLLLVPKEQSVLEHDTIKNLVNGLEGENVHAAADTFTHSLDDFNAAVARILK